MARPMSRAVESIRYRHAEDGEHYEHKFRPGVALETKADGSVRLRRPDGRRVWARFEGKPSRFLVNPKGAEIRPGQRARFLEYGTTEPLEVEVEQAYGPAAFYGKGSRAKRQADVWGRVVRAPRSSVRRFGERIRLYPAQLEQLASNDNPKEGRVATKRKKNRPSAKQRAARRRFAALARARGRKAKKKNRAARRRRAGRASSNPGRARSRKAVTRGGSMARKRRRSHRRNPARRRHRAKSVARRSNPGRRARRSFRRNPPAVGGRGLLGSIMSGVMGGAAVTGGQIATVMTARQLSFIPDTLAGGWTLVVKQALAAFGWTWLAARFLPGRWSPFVAAGAWAAPVQTAIRQSGVPVLSTGLGECDAGYGMIAGYAPASQPVLPSMQGYAPRSMPYTGAGDGQVGEYAPASFGNSTFGS